MSALYRKRGGFYYRTTAAYACLAVCALYGVIASLTLPIIGKTRLINWSVARSYYYIGGYFTGITAAVEGSEHMDPDRPTVYVCNHQSTLDIMLLGSVYPKATSMVAKKAIKYYPFLGWYMTLSKAIFLDRKNHNSAIKTARQAAEAIQKNQTSVWIFPEGTRGHPSKIDLLQFKKGPFYMAVQAGVPVVPVVMENYNHVYCSKAKRFNPGTVRIKVLPPVDTTDVAENSESIDKLANRVRDMMLDALKEISTSVDRKTQ
ncbi:hypothetical protein BJV82DRAFT_515790 [Fennellomyces sp. T-0311]|nr:hypothetical protein BJV82DRAFT_515790 [Fennellomyces sp. T-0311]